MKRYKQHFNEDEIEGGLSDNLSCQEIADKHGVSIDHIMTQLNKGIKIEMEHTDDEELAKEIAKDHITEYPYYYDELEKMEKKFENNRGIIMKRYKPQFKQIVKEDAEEDKSIKAIKDLIDLDWEKDEDAQHQALAMIKGLVLADTKSADKFLTDLSTYTSKMNVEDYSGKQEEGCKKKPKKKDLKEMISGINNILSAQEAVNLGIQFIASKMAFRDQRLYSNISFGIYNGIINSIDPELYEDVPGLAKIVVSKVCRALKERV